MKALEKAYKRVLAVFDGSNAPPVKVFTDEERRKLEEEMRGCDQNSKESNS